jgi:hypothetical protein
MRRILGLVVAGALWLGMASAADAQFSLSIGNPYTGGVAIGSPYVGGYGVLPGTSIYSSGYTGVYPGYTGVYPGYTGVYPGVSTVVAPYGYTSYYGYAPVYRYRGFGLRRGFVGGFW